MLTRRNLLTGSIVGALVAPTAAQAQEDNAQYITQNIEMVPPASTYATRYVVNNMDPAAPGYPLEAPDYWVWITPGSTNSATWLHLHTQPEIVKATLHVIGNAWHWWYGLGAKLVIQDRSGQFYHDVGDPLWLQIGQNQNRQDFTAELEAERLFQIEDEAATDPEWDPQEGHGVPLGIQFRGVGDVSRARLTVKYRLGG